MGTTIGAIGHACFGTASTTAAGLFALYVSKTRMLAEFGIVGGIGVMVSYIDTVVFLPAMLQSLYYRPAQLLQEQEEAQRSPSGSSHAVDASRCASCGDPGSCSRCLAAHAGGCRSRA